ncbi:SLOG family protein [Oceanobacillus locisalsi]|uniref:UPF0398 protein ACFQ19_07310 n=1 Tax=Oceanobacillus locisalsi TaxID=546107 RepID=A0ABW3NDS9_9BACI
MKILHVTGYKPTELGIFKEDDSRIVFIKAALEKRLRAFIEEGIEWVIISGQMGIELWTADVIMDLKEEYDIQIGVFPPFENQDQRWPDPIKEKYEELMMTADFFKPLYKGEYQGAYQFRAKDLWLIDKSDAALLLVDDENPGSVNYFYQATQRTSKEYPIFTITPQDLEETVEELQMQDPNYWDEPDNY